MTNLETQLPELYASAITLFGQTKPIVIALLFIGFSLKVGWSMFGDAGQILRALLGVSVCALMIGILPDLMNDLQRFAYAFIEHIDASPSTLHHDFAELILSSGEDANKPIGFWDIILSRDVGLGEAISYAFVYVGSQCAWAVSYLLQWLQQVLLIYGTAVAPVFVAFFMLEVLRPVAGKFFMGMFSVAFWPLGWAIANVVSQSLIQLSAGPEGELNSNAFWSVLLLSLWLIFSAIAAPLVIHKMLSTGVNAGASLVKNFVTSIATAGTHAVGGAVTASMMGAGKGWAGAAAATSGAAGFVSSSAGSSSTLPPAFIGVAAGYLGSRATPPRGNYSQQAEAIYNQSR
ncbi:MAG: hypothetical protein AAF065_13930 [Verrucomicrobiota bacterium]